jgi:hypothetical protein
VAAQPGLEARSDPDSSDAADAIHAAADEDTHDTGYAASDAHADIQRPSGPPGDHRAFLGPLIPSSF